MLNSAPTRSLRIDLRGPCNDSRCAVRSYTSTAVSHSSGKVQKEDRGENVVGPRRAGTGADQIEYLRSTRSCFPLETALAQMVPFVESRQPITILTIGFPFKQHDNGLKATGPWPEQGQAARGAGQGRRRDIPARIERAFDSGFLHKLSGRMRRILGAAVRNARATRIERDLKNPLRPCNVPKIRCIALDDETRRRCPRRSRRLQGAASNDKDGAADGDLGSGNRIHIQPGRQCEGPQPLFLVLQRRPGKCMTWWRTGHRCRGFLRRGPSAAAATRAGE